MMGRGWSGLTWRLLIAIWLRWEASGRINHSAIAGVWLSKPIPRYWPLIIQQLLVGTNAHINFDLGIAAAGIAPGSELPTIRADFDRINTILGSMISKVRTDIEGVSPWIKFIDRLAPTHEDTIINFSLNKARASAWLVATLVNATPAENLGTKLSILDDGVAMLGSLIGSPKGLLVNLALRGIRLRESNDVPHIIDVLSEM